MKRIKKENEIIFTDNFGKIIYRTNLIDWQKEYGNYFGKLMQMAEEQIQWIAANTNIPGFEPTDILQELRTHMLKKIPKYNPQKASVSGFVQFISYNKKIDLWRSSQKEKRKSLNESISLNENRI